MLSTTSHNDMTQTNVTYLYQNTFGGNDFITKELFQNSANSTTLRNQITLFSACLFLFHLFFSPYSSLSIYLSFFLSIPLSFFSLSLSLSLVLCLFHSLSHIRFLSWVYPDLLSLSISSSQKTNGNKIISNKSI